MDPITAVIARQDEILNRELDDFLNSWIASNYCINHEDSMTRSKPKPEPAVIPALWESEVCSSDEVYLPLAALVETIANAFLLAAGRDCCDDIRKSNTKVTARVNDYGGPLFPGDKIRVTIKLRELVSKLAATFRDEAVKEDSPIVKSMISALQLDNSVTSVNLKDIRVMSLLLGKIPFDAPDTIELPEFNSLLPSVQEIVQRNKELEDKVEKQISDIKALTSELKTLKESNAVQGAKEWKALYEEVSTAFKDWREGTIETTKTNERLLTQISQLQDSRAILKVLEPKHKELQDAISNIATTLVESLDDNEVSLETTEDKLKYISDTLDALLTARSMPVTQEVVVSNQETPSTGFQQAELLKSLLVMRLLFGDSKRK